MMDIFHISRPRFLHTIGWALFSSILIVGVVSFLARATLNLKAALTDKPDLGVYLLLDEKGVLDADLLREKKDERDYLVKTKSGMRFVKLKKGSEKWFVAVDEPMHEETNQSSSGSSTGSGSSVSSN